MFFQKEKNMFLESLTLKNFRCFENAELKFTERMSVIAGDNGSWKIAVLEAAAIAADSTKEGWKTAHPL